MCLELRRYWILVAFCPNLILSSSHHWVSGVWFSHLDCAKGATDEPHASSDREIMNPDEDERLRHDSLGHGSFRLVKRSLAQLPVLVAAPGKYLPSFRQHHAMLSATCCLLNDPLSEWFYQSWKPWQHGFRGSKQVLDSQSSISCEKTSYTTLQQWTL